MWFPMTRTTTAPQRGVVASFAFMLISMLSAQALAQTFDFDGITYYVNPFTIATDVEVRGRASGNTARDIVIPATVVDSGTRYSVTSVGFQAFRANGLTSETFPEFMTIIKNSAFRFESIASVTFPDSMTLIENAAFFDSVLTSPVSLRDFGIFSPATFTVTPKLASITYAQGATGWDDVTFTRAGKDSLTTEEVDCAAPVPAVTPLATAGWAGQAAVGADRVALPCSFLRR